MWVENITWLEKPLMKLIETISQWIWTVSNHIWEFDSKKIKRIWEAEAFSKKVEIIKLAEWKNEESLILNRAKKRFALEQYDKQVNLENIFSETKDKLEWDQVSEKPVDKDWISKFMSIAQDISRKEIQDLLSNILSEEIKKPDTVSYRTLDLVKNLTQKELLLFKRLSLISSTDWVVYIVDNNFDSNKWFFNDLLKLNFEDYLELSDLWLIQSNSISYGWIVSNFSEDLEKNDLLTLKFLNHSDIKFKSKNNNLELRIIIFTKIWKEISSLLKINTDIDKDIINKYFIKLNDFLIKDKKVEKI